MAPRSGAGIARGLWLFLLPMLLVNLVHWMRPADPRHRATAHRCYSVIVRLAAAALTVHFVAAYAEISLDLTVWQCGASAQCTDTHSWLAFLHAGGRSWWADEPGRGLALAAMLPLGLIALVNALNRRTWRRTEALRPLSPYAGGRFDGTPGDAPLSRPGFWYGKRPVARLRRTHTALGLSTVSVLVLIPCLEHDRGTDFGPLTVIGWSLAGLLAALGGLALWVTARSGRSEFRLDERRDVALARLLTGGGALLTAAVVMYAGWPRDAWSPVGPLPGTAPLFSTLLAAEVTLVVALGITCAVMNRSVPSRGALLHGFGGPVVLLLATWFATAFASSQSLLAADFLDGSAESGGTDTPLVGLPAFMEVFALGLVVMLLVIVGTAAATWVDGLRRARRLRFEVERDYPHERPEQERTLEIVRAITSAQNTDRLPLFLATSGAAAALTLTAAALTGWTDPTLLDDLTHAEASVVLIKILGEWLGPLLLGGFLVLGWMAYLYPGTRRSTGLLWDVTTFWPRAAQPFAPPCLAERVVPDLQWRATAWTATTNGRLMFSGHGQGSVWAAAAILQMSPQNRRRTTLLTYGSPLARIYGRYFPAYFGPHQLAGLHRDIEAWRNLWRRTDPLGGPVRPPHAAREGTEADTEPLRDPASYGRTVAHPLFTPILGDEDYPADPRFAHERAALVARLKRPVRREPE